MDTLSLMTKESILEKKLLPGKDRLAFSLMERTLSSERPLILSDGESCILGQADITSPAWIWTRSDVSDETLDGLLLTLTALYEQGRLASVISKRGISTLLSAAFDGRIKNMETLAVYCLDRLCPFHTEGEMIPGKDVPPETAGVMIRRLAEFAGEKISYETQRDMGLLFTQNENAYAWRTPNGEIVSVAKIAYSDSRFADIHSVFTREEMRNRGYAKALLTGMCERILEAEKIPMLYADRDYAPSNHMYRRLGFTEKASLSVLRFTEPGDIGDGATCASGGKEL